MGANEKEEASEAETEEMSGAAMELLEQERSVFEEFLEAAAVPRRRRFQEFAEEEIFLPDGPRKGLPFRCEFMPFSRLVLEEYDAGRYRRFFLSGPVQGGKTLLGFQIPALYHLFECGQDVILGAPTVELAQAIWQQRLKPIINMTRYRELIPQEGAGSRGGKSLAIQFRNGAVLRFMGAGGGDEQRSSHTAPVVILTEVDKMDEAGAVSREADPVSQIEARADSYGSQARVYAECTMSTEEGRMAREVLKYGTATRVFVACPVCQEWQSPEREHFSGWEDAADVMVARRNAGYACQYCGVVWTESQRIAALYRPVLVHDGQEMTPDGQVHGITRDTNTWGFRWNAMHSPLRTMADIAERMWRAEQSDREEDQRAISQFVWALPHKGDTQSLTGITREVVLNKITRRPRGVAPATTVCVTAHYDLGLYRCWYAAVAWCPQCEGFVIDYERLDVGQGQNPSELAVLSALRAHRDDVLAHGYKTDDNKSVTVTLAGVDEGYLQTIARRFAAESNGARVGGAKWVTTKGFGTGTRQQRWASPKPGSGRKIGRDWALLPEGDVHMAACHADAWKRAVHSGWLAPSGTAGALHVFHADPRAHRIFADHQSAEREEEEFKPGHGTRRYWATVRRENHWFDTVCNCRALADMAGVKLEGSGKRDRGPGARDRGGERGGGKIRSKY